MCKRFALLMVCVMLLMCGCVSEPDIMTVPYMGTNGNVWIGKEDTGTLWEGYVPVVKEEKGYILADTLAIRDNRVFDSFFADTSVDYILFPEIYSGYHISSLTVCSEAAGKICLSTVGTDVQYASVTASSLKGTKEYDVTEGVCTVDCDISVGENETLVIGGSASNAKIKVFTGITNDAGNGDVLVGDAKDAKLCCKVLTDGMSEKNLVCCDTFTKFPLGTVSTYVPWNMSAAPFVYANDYFSGCVVTGITLPASDVKAGQTLTVSVVKFEGGLAGKITETLETRVITASGDASKTPLYCPLDSLTVPEGYTLAFGKPGDTMSLLYLNAGTVNLDFGLGFYHNASSSGANSLTKGLAFEVYGTVPFVTPAQKAQAMNEESDKALSADELSSLVEALGGKKLSILGDSISTYEGISNNTASNPTIGQNAVWYNSSKLPLESVWWKKVMGATDMKLCVNNSFSGSEVLANSGIIWQSRCVELHSADEKPDVIFMWMGTNDYQRGRYSQIGSLSGIDFDSLSTKTPATFAEAYALSLVKMKQAYPDAEILCFSIMPTRFTNSTFVQGLSDGAILGEYNDLIRDIAERCSCRFVDLSGTGFEFYNIASYTLGDALHPNADGMSVISETVLRQLYGFFCD